MDKPRHAVGNGRLATEVFAVLTPAALIVGYLAEKLLPNAPTEIHDAFTALTVGVGVLAFSIYRDRRGGERGHGGQGGQGGAGQDGQDGMPGGQGGAGGQGGQARVAVGVLALALLAACAAYDGPTYASLARAEIRAEAFGLDRCEAHREAAEALRADGPTRTLWVTAGKSLQTLAADHEQYAVLCRRTAQLAASSRASDDQLERYMAKSRRTWRAGMEELGMEVAR